MYMVNSLAIPLSALFTPAFTKDPPRCRGNRTTSVVPRCGSGANSSHGDVTKLTQPWNTGKPYSLSLVQANYTLIAE